MDGWLRIKDAGKSTLQTKQPGVLFNVVVSPYDVPEALRYRKVDEGCFRIEFRYIDGQEPGRVRQIDEHVSVHEGRHSQRLLAIDVNMKSLGANSVGVAISMETAKLWLDSAIKELESLPSAAATNNTKVRGAIKERESELLECVVSGA